MALEEIKAELKINSELTGIVDALKVIAVTEFRALEEEREQRSSVFLDAFEGFFQMIDFSAVEHPFAQDRSGSLALIMLTSDERFMGGLNKRVVDSALAYPGADTAYLAVMGMQGGDYLRTLDREFTSFTDITTKNPYAAALRLREYILKTALEGNLGRLVIVYPKPISFLVQTVEALPILPCTELLFLEKREARKREMILEKAEAIIDSSQSDLIEYLVGTWIAEKMLEVLEDARQAELSAKAVRLEESYQTLLDTKKKLVHQYHRTHHEMLDKEMRDTFSAQIMRGKTA